uniref:Golgi SNAP receptor complex member 1 n=1 Tax=Blastobotrys adeninivorans TaxID=409370 RepID=A0A060T1L7_BLAAD
MATFAQARSQARALETKTESLLSDLSSFVQSVSSSATAEEVKTNKEIEDTLASREEVIATLTRAVDSDAHAPATKLHQLQRHKEVLQEHKAEFRRIKASLQQERNRTNLLTSVRSDIDSYRARSSTPGGQNEAEYMLNERSRIDNSHNLADTLLSQAYETRDDFVRQRASLANIQRRVFSTASHIPGLNTVISKINTRKKRDSVILALLIAACILFLFFMR